MRAIHVDRRQQKGKHDNLHDGLREAGAVLVSHSLDTGDYAFAPRCSVDKKRDLYELAACVTTQHERFANECERAKEQGTTLVILTVNDQGVSCVADLAAWMEPDADFEVRCEKSKGKVKRRLVGSTLAKTCETMHHDHGTYFAFCSPRDEANKMIEILKWGETLADNDGTVGAGPGGD